MVSPVSCPYYWSSVPLTAAPKGIPDFRGPDGSWTLLAQGRRRDGPTTSTLQAIPTPSHMALVELQNRGLLKYVVSQNCDGLHKRSGIPSVCCIDSQDVQSRRWLIHQFRIRYQKFTATVIWNTAKPAAKNTSEASHSSFLYTTKPTTD